jgi:hypothetical protein
MDFVLLLVVSLLLVAPGPALAEQAPIFSPPAAA